MVRFCAQDAARLRTDMMTMLGRTPAPAAAAVAQLGGPPINPRECSQ